MLTGAAVARGRRGRTCAAPIGLCRDGQLRLGLVLLRLELLCVTAASVMSLCLGLKKRQQRDRRLIFLFALVHVRIKVLFSLETCFWDSRGGVVLSVCPCCEKSTPLLEHDIVRIMDSYNNFFLFFIHFSALSITGTCHQECSSTTSDWVGELVFYPSSSKRDFKPLASRRFEESATEVW